MTDAPQSDLLPDIAIQLRREAESCADVCCILRTANVMRTGADEIDRLRMALRSFVVAKTVRMASGGGFIPNGGFCQLCNCDWNVNEPERHKSDCMANELRRATPSPIWQPIESAPKDGTPVDLWTTRKTCMRNMRWLRGAEVDPRAGPGGIWEHLAMNGWREPNPDDEGCGCLVEEQFTHWRYPVPPPVERGPEPGVAEDGRQPEPKASTPTNTWRDGIEAAAKVCETYAAKSALHKDLRPETLALAIRDAIRALAGS